jgi:hypothetical protein
MKRLPGASALTALAFCMMAAVAPPADAAQRQKTGLSWPSELRLPWQAERRPVRRSARTAKPPRPAKPRAAKAVPAVRQQAVARTPPLPRPNPLIQKPPAPEDDPLLAALPPPDALPPLPPEGPAPAPMTVAATNPTPLPPAREQAPAEAIPVPPERAPVAVDATPSPEGPPLPPSRSGEQKVAVVPPVAPLAPSESPVPTAPDTPLPETARADDADCVALEREGVAVIKTLPPISDLEVCGAPAPVELSGVRRKDGGVVEIKPALTLRCAMARAFAVYVRDDLAPAAGAMGKTLTQVQTASSYVCRGRNGAPGGKMSEHGRANAVDVSGFGFGGGESYEVYDAALPKPFAALVKTAACDRFSTVLGPGSDAHHDDHLHVDLQPRRAGRGKLCSWKDEPEEVPAPQTVGFDGTPGPPPARDR